MKCDAQYQYSTVQYNIKGLLPCLLSLPNVHTELGKRTFGYSTTGCTLRLECITEYYRYYIDIDLISLNAFTSIQKDRIMCRVDFVEFIASTEILSFFRLLCVVILSLCFVSVLTDLFLVCADACLDQESIQKEFLISMGSFLVK